MILAPASRAELADMLTWAIEEYNGPVAIRYPRGTDLAYTQSAWELRSDVPVQGALKCHCSGSDVTLVVYGTLLQNAMDAVCILEQHGIKSTVLRLLTVAPLPVDQILEHLSSNPHVVVLEEVCAESGIRQTLAWELSHRVPAIKVDGLDLGHRYVTHGSIQALYKHCGLDAESIAHFVQEVLQNEN